MMRHRHARPARAIFHQNLGVLLLVDRDQFGRPVKIALGIRRAHFDLAFADSDNVAEFAPGRLIRESDNLPLQPCPAPAGK